MKEPRVIRTKEELTLLGVEWQARLRIQDWNIDYRLVNSGEIDSFAQSRGSDSCKEAIVKVCIFEQISPGWLGSPDMEVTLVHELLHIANSLAEYKIQHDHTKDLKATTDPHWLTYEAFIETTAQTLVRLQRNREEAEAKVAVLEKMLAGTSSCLSAAIAAGVAG